MRESERIADVAIYCKRVRTVYSRAMLQRRTSRYRKRVTDRPENDVQVFLRVGAQRSKNHFR